MKDHTLSIIVPESFLAEREYLADVVFRQFLAMPYTIRAEKSLIGCCNIVVGGKTITIKDDFFSRINEAKGYLSKEFLPVNVAFVTSPFLVENDIPLLYGNNEITVTAEGINCGHDIFAAVFFMLSRWEECVVKETDYLERFPASASVALKNNFLHRPVVNEWIGMLKNMIAHLLPGVAFNNPQPFELVFTHDIDLLNTPVSIKEFAKDMLKRKRPAAFKKRLGYLFNRSNPYDVFDYFMDVSERNNTLSRFYFMTGHNVPGRDGEPYNKTALYPQMLKRIRERGHILGFHPSLLSYNDAAMFSKEKQQLERDIGAPVVEGRQHALRFKLPDTWNLWEAQGMKTDSTLGYSAKEGFRCGTGNTFSVFDVSGRKNLRLKEMPLVIMDTTLHVNRKLGIEVSKQTINYFIDKGRKYDMPVTLLFHNLINEEIDWKGWKLLYQDLFWK